MTALPCLLAIISSPSALAADAPVPALVQQPSAVGGAIAGTAADAAALEAVLADSLSRQGLTLQLIRIDHIELGDITREMENAPALVASFRLDLTGLPRAKLYLTDGERRRVHVRWLSLQRGLDPTAIELVRFVIESSIEAIRGGRDIGISREEYETSLKPPPPTPPAPPASPAPSQTPAPRPTTILAPAPRELARLSLAAAYEVVRLRSGSTQQGPGLSLSLRFRRVWIGASATARLPLTIGDETTSARLFTGAFRATAAFAVAVTPPFAFALGAGAGIDASHVAPSVQRQDLTALSPFWASSPFVRVFAQADRFFGWASVGALVGVDVDLLGERYLVAEGGGPRPTFTPNRLRPLLAIKVGAHR